LPFPPAIGYSQRNYGADRSGRVPVSGLLSKILPHERSFYSMFVDLAETVNEGALTLIEMLRDFENAPRHAEKIKQIEHKGDTITHSLITKLNQTFITPFDREDIHMLSSRIDDVLDFVDAAASRMVLYRIERVRPGVLELAEVLQQAAARILEAIRSLDKHDHILDHCIEINRLENEADRISRALIAQLFAEEKDPVEILKWKEIIEVLETGTDKAEDVANVIEAITVKGA
jgi:predicted phosphate transport protein (TIGR00153 family)